MLILKYTQVVVEQMVQYQQNFPEMKTQKHYK